MPGSAMTEKPAAIPSTPSAEAYAEEVDRPLIPDAPEPFALLESWLEEAGETEPNDPNAAALATVDGDGVPDVRVVLVRGLSPEQGLTFFTNYQSAKGRQLDGIPQAALCFHWKSQRRQVRIRGAVCRASSEVSDTYFNQRAAQSRMAAIVSDQSQPLAERSIFESRLDAVAEAYPETDFIPRPAHWGGYHLKPVQIEFWQDQKFRMHDRLQFCFINEIWSRTRLYP